MKRILLLIHKLDRGMYAFMALGALVEALESFGMILLSSVLLERLLAGDSMQRVLVLMAALVVGYGLLNMARLWLQEARTYRVDRLTYRYRQMITEKVMAVPFEQLERVEFTELLSVVRNNDQNYSLLPLTLDSVYAILRCVFSILVAAISFIDLFGVIGSLGEANFMVSMLVLGVFVLIVASTGYVVWRKKENARVEKKLDEEMAQMNARSMAFVQIVTSYPMGKHIRLGRMQPRMIQEWSRFEGNFREWMKNIMRLDRGVNLVADSSSTLISGMIYFTVGVVSLAGGLGVGSIIWYAGVVQRLLESVRNFIFKVGSLHSQCVRQLPVFELMEIADSDELSAPAGSEASVPTGSGFAAPSASATSRQTSGASAPTGPSLSAPSVLAGPSPVKRGAGHTIEFEDVSFAYPDTDRMILEHVNLRLSGQERIALVGRNGCGKSTLIKLICRLYDPTEGRILLDGIDIRTIPRREYRKILSVVFQDFYIFADSLAGNIAMGDQVNRTRATDIVNRVGLHISNLDQPLRRDLEEKGIEVSGGEGQKIAIARALYKDAPMVILDEPTAALDPISESEIYEKFNLLVDGKLALFISHRLSSCRFCDRILVLQDGDIIQDGSHEELVAADGLYQRMWNAQKQYYV